MGATIEIAIVAIGGVILLLVNLGYISTEIERTPLGLSPLSVLAAIWVVLVSAPVVHES